MVKKHIDGEIDKVLTAYVAELRKHYKIDYVILFGSYAKGKQNEDSDIDVAVVSAEIKNPYFDRLDLMRLRRKIDSRIEPHAINTDEFRQNANPFINEIKNTGIQVFVA